MNRKMSTISVLHCYKLFFRSGLFLAALIIYLRARIIHGEISLADYASDSVALGILSAIFIGEMALRFFPSRLESMGCQKQFRRNYIPTEISQPPRRSPLPVLAVALAWLLLNGVIGALYLAHIIDEGILILISLFYSVCDMICILFFCPFQTWFLKDKCCGSCRIYNWDYAMMFTPLVFIPSVFSYSVLGVALLLLLAWEITVRLHPERFSEQTNQCLSCANCKEKLCHHKTQLRHFLKVNRRLLALKGNEVIGRVRERLNKKD